MDSRVTSFLRRSAFIFGVAMIAFGAFVGIAQAATPAWKLLATTGPTNFPPRQSEVQRVTVEAEGGTFKLSQRGAEGSGTPVFLDAQLSFTENSPIATIESITGNGTVEVGDRVTDPAEYLGSNILACSSDCEEPGSTIELSEAAPATQTGVHKQILTRELSGVVGPFKVGEEIAEVRNYEGEGPFSYFLPGTVITAVGPGTITLSNPTTGEYSTGEGAVGPLQIIANSVTAPIAVNASAATVQSALSSALGAGSVSVSGGPGGTAEQPYIVNFTGPLAEKDVEELQADGSGLVGPHAAATVLTTLPGGPGTGRILVAPANVGGATTFGEYSMHLGPLPPGVVISGPVVDTEGWDCPNAGGESSITCTATTEVPPLTPANNIVIPVEVEPSVASTGSVPVTLTGGDAGSDSIEMPLVISRQEARPGATAFWAGSFNEDGELETQAGGHPFSAISYFMLNTVRAVNGKVIPTGDSRDVIVDLPPGFAGNPLVTDRCPQAQVIPPGLTEPESPVCNYGMTVGVFGPILDSFGISALRFNFPFYNDVPPKGYAAEFTSKIGLPPQSLLASVRSSEDFGIRITAPNNPTISKVYGSFAALEGEPPAAKGAPFLRNGSECGGASPVVRTKSDTWQEPGVYSTAADQVLPPLTGCDKIEFPASLNFEPNTKTGSSGTGATVQLDVAQEGLKDANKLASADLKKAVVKLPEGLILNPSSANGLEGCSEAQIGFMGSDFAMPNPIRFDEESPTCPDGSKLGTVEINTPMLEAPLQGTIYLAAQEENPFGSLIAIYLAVDDPRTGVVLKLPGEVVPDSATGQLTATFDYNPQLPFENLTLQFRGGGPHSQLATPEICGHYATTGSLTPWSAPQSGPPVQIEEAGFTVSSGCSSSPATRPFAPSFEAGTTGTTAGAYSPLVVKASRKDGEQELTSLDFTLPKGLIGKLAGIPYCSDAAIAAASSKSGKQEVANPSCPATSRLGSVDTSAGFGSEPFHVGGSVYLAGPYKGAPVSAVVVTPALAGPFDLGNVVIRSPLYINPETAQLTVKSDPIPTILKGIPLKIRSVAINVDRPGFMLNPTSCEPMTASASIGGGSGAVATPSNRFQVGGCDKLKFAPKLKLSLKGGTRRNSHPALTAVLTQPAGQANIGRVSVALPHSEFLEQSHIRTICTRVQFAANQCPAAAIYGQAEAITPLLDQPLRGPVYLRSSSNKLPDLVAALKGPASQPIEVDLDGRIDSVKGGIRNTFELVPDAPVSKFVLKMQGAKKGLLVNSTNICRGTHKGTVKMTGQNGLEHDFSTPLEAQCGKKGGKSKKNPKKSAKRERLSTLSAGW